MTRRPLVYIAGPYSSNPDVCTYQAMSVGSRMIDAGLTPIIPHLTHFIELQFPRPYEQWMDYDAELLQVCAHVYRIPGESSGADREVALAEECGIHVWLPEHGDLGAFIADVKGER